MKQWQNEVYSLYNEARKFQAGEVHPEFGSIPTKFRQAGHTAATRDAAHFITSFLGGMGILSAEEVESVTKNNNLASKRQTMIDLLGKYSGEIRSKSQEITDTIAGAFDKFSKRETINRGRGSTGRQEKYSSNAAAVELAKRQSQELKQMKRAAKAPAAAALDVLSVGLDNAEQELVGSMKDSYEDPTTIFEFQLADQRAAGRVASFLQPYAGGAEIEVNGSTVEFSASPDSDLVKLIQKVGADRVKRTLESEIEKIAGENVVIIIEPDSPEDAKALVGNIMQQRPRKDTTDTTVSGYSQDAPKSEDSTSWDYGAEEEEGLDDHWGSRRSPEEHPGVEQDYPDADDDYPTYKGGQSVGPCPHCGDPMEIGDEGPEERICDACVADNDLKRREHNSHREENNEDSGRMSPQAADRWMNQQRAQRMQNFMKHDERWG